MKRKYRRTVSKESKWIGNLIRSLFWDLGQSIDWKNSAPKEKRKRKG